MILACEMSGPKGSRCQDGLHILCHAYPFAYDTMPESQEEGGAGAEEEEEAKAEEAKGEEEEEEEEDEG